MQYLLMIYDDEKNWQNMDEAEQGNLIERYIALEEDLKDKGQYVAGARLTEVENATSVRVRDNKTLITDGPFAETKEQLGGYFLIECDDLDQATNIAARIPSSEVGTIEVRPLWYQPEEN